MSTAVAAEYPPVRLTRFGSLLHSRRGLALFLLLLQKNSIPPGGNRVIVFLLGLLFLKAFALKGALADLHSKLSYRTTPGLGKLVDHLRSLLTLIQELLPKPKFCTKLPHAHLNFCSSQGNHHSL